MFVGIVVCEKVFELCRNSDGRICDNQIVVIEININIHTLVVFFPINNQTVYCGFFRIGKVYDGRI